MRLALPTWVSIRADKSLTTDFPLTCLSGPEYIFIYKPEANAVCTLALRTMGVSHLLRKLKLKLCQTTARVLLGLKGRCPVVCSICLSFCPC